MVVRISVFLLIDTSKGWALKRFLLRESGIQGILKSFSVRNFQEEYPSCPTFGIGEEPEVDCEESEYHGNIRAKLEMK